MNIISKADWYSGGRKRIFIGLLCLSCIALCLFFLAFLVFPWLGDNPAILRPVSIAIGCAAIALMVWLCVSLVLHIYTGRQFAGIAQVRHLMIRLLLPLMEIMGKCVGIDKNLVRRSFIKVNNEFVMAGYQSVRPQKILVLLPHCIQFGACPRRLLFSLDNCANCGKCQIGVLRELSRKYGFQIAVATGGTVARRIVVECRPEYIIAVACERDLTSGIQDSYPVPVYGILNERPHGPCHDTIAPYEPLFQVLAFFLNTSVPAEAQLVGNSGCPDT